MKLVEFSDVPLAVWSEGMQMVKQESQAVLIFDNNWILSDVIIRKPKANLPLVAVIGPSKIGPVVHLEVGFRRFLPYRKAGPSSARAIYLPPRFKLAGGFEINWPSVLPRLSLVMEELAGDIIRNWQDWDNHLGFTYHYARSFRTRADYVKKSWLPPKDGISFHISEFDEYLWQVLSLAGLHTNRRFHKKMKGLLGVIHVIQIHFNLYDDIYKKRRLQTIRTVISDSSLPQVAKNPKEFKALLSFSYQRGNQEFFVSKPQEFVNFLKKLGYVPKDLFREYMNYCAEIDRHRQEYKRTAEFIGALTNNLQVSLYGIKKRKITAKVAGRFAERDSYYYSFKVYCEETAEKESHPQSGDNDVPF